MPGQQSLDVLERRPLAGNVTEEKEFVPGGGIKLSRNACRNQRFLFRRKQQRAVPLGIDQRLDTLPITRDKQLLLVCIPNRKGKHAVELLEHRRTVAAIHGEDYFRIGVRPEAITPCFQLRAQLPVVVHFPVVNDPVAAIFGCHGHAAARREIENGESL